MAAVLALPKVRDLPHDEIAATFVVPAPRGCNLNCSFCFIRLRREAPPGEAQLAEKDYVDFLEELARRSRVGLVSLQGYEPLLPESWPYSKALLCRARALGIDTALVTNGTLLAERVDDLVRLEVQGITVSVDSADPAMHDRSRGTPGAFTATLRGLEAARKSDLYERVVVASVLQRAKAHYLHDMPRLLSDLSIGRWVVTPVYKIGRSRDGGPSDSPESIVLQLMRLNAVAKEQGIQLIVDDEFKGLAEQLGNRISGEALLTRQLMRFDQVVRLSPHGACSIGKDILRRADSGIPVWRPDVETAGAFLKRASRKGPTLVPCTDL